MAPAARMNPPPATLLIVMQSAPAAEPAPPGSPSGPLRRLPSRARRLLLCMKSYRSPDRDHTSPQAARDAESSCSRKPCNSMSLAPQWPLAACLMQTRTPQRRSSQRTPAPITGQENHDSGFAIRTDGAKTPDLSSTRLTSPSPSRIHDAHQKQRICSQRQLQRSHAPVNIPWRGHSRGRIHGGDLLWRRVTGGCPLPDTQAIRCRNCDPLAGWPLAH